MKRAQRQGLSVVPIGREKQRALGSYSFHQRQNHCMKRRENEQTQRQRTELATLNKETDI